MEVGTCDVIIKVTISVRPLLYTNKRDRTLFGTNDESGESMLADPWGYLYRRDVIVFTIQRDRITLYFSAF